MNRAALMEREGLPLLRTVLVAFRDAAGRLLGTLVATVTAPADSIWIVPDPAGTVVLEERHRRETSGCGKGRKCSPCSV